MPSRSNVRLRAAPNPIGGNGGGEVPAPIDGISGVGGGAGGGEARTLVCLKSRADAGISSGPFDAMSEMS